MPSSLFNAFLERAIILEPCTLPRSVNKKPLLAFFKQLIYPIGDIFYDRIR